MSQPLRVSTNNVHHQLPNTSDFGLRMIQRRCGGLQLLVEAHDCARELERSAWDFAIEIRSLYELEMTSCDLRWLACRGYVEHAREATPQGDSPRSFEKNSSLNFNAETCFVLTNAGLTFARCALQFSEPVDPHAYPTVESESAATNGEQTLRPFWDRNTRELQLDQIVVKRFKVPAPNQILILSVFQESNWPVLIDDPLPPRPEVDPKRRLHDTINALNRNQRRRLVHFKGNGSGEGIQWELMLPSAEPADDESPVAAKIRRLQRGAALVSTV